MHCSSILKRNISSLFHQSSLPHSHSVSPSPTPYFSRCAVVACLWWCFFFCKVPLPLSPHSFSFKACTGAGLGPWFDLCMVVDWDWLMVGLTKVWIGAPMVIFFFNGFDRGLLCFFFFFWWCWWLERVVLMVWCFFFLSVDSRLWVAGWWWFQVCVVQRWWACVVL